MTDEDLTRLLALDGAPGPALVLDAADTNGLIERALDGAGFGPAGGGGHGGPGHGGPGHAGPAGGAGATVRGLAAGTKLAIGALALAVVVVIAVLVLRRSHGAHVAAATIDAAIDAAPDASAGGSGLEAVGSAAGSSDAAGSGNDTGSDDDADVELDPEPAHPHRPRPVETRAAADLLGEANAKRVARQWRESDALYMRVVRRAPRSLAAQTALVASASLRLEHLGDPKGAAARFRRALAIAPDGALAEEARWGLAEAARARHDDAAEAHALDDFLAHHPGSPRAAQARARRAELP